MTSISVGTDTYGRVKAVAGTHVVTKFAMLQFLPVYPLQSFYFVKAGPSSATNIPFLGSTHFATVIGIPLSTLDKASVVMAYVRGIFAALIICGLMVLIPGIMYLTGERLDDLAMIMTRGLLCALVVGIVGGTLTYAVPLTPHREKEIRRLCAEQLGISADPARVPSDVSKILVEHSHENLQGLEHPRGRLIHQLIVTRAELTYATDADSLEAKTDVLLDQLGEEKWAE